MLDLPANLNPCSLGVCACGYLGWRYLRGRPVGPVRLRTTDFLNKARAGDLHLNRQVQDVGAVAGQPDVVIKIEREEGDAGPFPGAHVDTGEDGSDQQDVFLDCQEGVHEPGELGEVTARARGDQMFSLSLY